MSIVFDKEFRLRGVCEVGEAFCLRSQIEGAEFDSFTYKTNANLGGGGHTMPLLHPSWS